MSIWHIERTSGWERATEGGAPVFSARFALGEPTAVQTADGTSYELERIPGTSADYQLRAAEGSVLATAHASRHRFMNAKELRVGERTLMLRYRRLLSQTLELVDAHGTRLAEVRIAKAWKDTVQAEFLADCPFPERLFAVTAGMQMWHDHGPKYPAGA